MSPRVRSPPAPRRTWRIWQARRHEVAPAPAACRRRAGRHRGRASPGPSGADRRSAGHRGEPGAAAVHAGAAAGHGARHQGGRGAGRAAAGRGDAGVGHVRRGPRRRRLRPEPAGPVRPGRGQLAGRLAQRPPAGRGRRRGTRPVDAGGAGARRGGRRRGPRRRRAGRHRSGRGGRLRRALAAPAACPVAPVLLGRAGRAARLRARPRQPAGVRRHAVPSHRDGPRSSVTTEQTTAEEPWPVRTVARKISEWINRLGAVWVEGQVTQISARPGTGTAFLTLRDPAADLSITVTCPTELLRAHEPPLSDGARVVLHAKPMFFVSRGTLSLRADEIRAVGVGELLARIERLRRLLAAEGLFDPKRKRRLPFLPNTVGLVTGRASAAERDVLANARARWPAVRFRIENVATQGALAVPQIVDALST